MLRERKKCNSCSQEYSTKSDLMADLIFEQVTKHGNEDGKQRYKLKLKALRDIYSKGVIPLRKL